VSPLRLPPLGELVNALEFEEPAKLTLDAATFATIAGGDRAAFDRITLRPRMMVPTLDLDLSVELFGDVHFTPLVVGPVAEQRRYHRDGESATVRGAAAAHTAIVLSSRSSVPIAELTAQPAAPIWFAVYADAPDARKQIDQARAAGCKVTCITAEGSGPPNWKRIEALCRGLAGPFVIKGVLTPHDAKTALDRGAAGVVVSNHGSASATSAPMTMLPAVVEACAGKAAVLVDGGFRRGSDIAKALALGAHGVLLARPVMWALAAYGADGVRTVLELLQSDLARTMGALGAPNLERLTREMVRIHRR
jgi:4-hydroxymandelate oxidase